MDPVTTTTVGMETIIENTGSVVTGLFGWVGDITSTVTGNPVLAVFCLGIPLVTLAIGLFVRFTRRRSK